jgi:hypothetical protein
VHGLAYNGNVVAFKMGGVGKATRFASSERAKRRRFAYIAHWPASRILRKRNTPKTTAIMISVPNMLVARADP